MFLIITGNFNVEESLAIINETMNNMTFKEYEKPIINIIKEPFRVKNEYTQKEMNVDNYKVSIGLKIPKDNFKSLKLSDLELKLYLNLFMRMNFGITSLLNENLQTNKIITDQISTALIESNDYFTEAIIASTDYPDYLIKKVKETISNNTILDDDIKRKAKTSISNLIMMFDDIELVNNEIQDDIIAYNHYYDNMYDYYNNLNSEIAKKFITKLNNYTMAISILKPQK
jgi:predicted Zn-dependent peptidase